MRYITVCCVHIYDQNDNIEKQFILKAPRQLSRIGPKKSGYLCALRSREGQHTCYMYIQARQSSDYFLFEDKLSEISKLHHVRFAGLFHGTHLINLEYLSLYLIVSLYFLYTECNLSFWLLYKVMLIFCFLMWSYSGQLPAHKPN